MNWYTASYSENDWDFSIDGPIISDKQRAIKQGQQVDKLGTDWEQN